jgi:hypothetical protein
MVEGMESYREQQVVALQFHMEWYSFLEVLAHLEWKASLLEMAKLESMVANPFQKVGLLEWLLALFFEPKVMA